MRIEGLFLRHSEPKRERDVFEDDFLESLYEERYEKPDYEVWEERQLDLDRDAGEFDFDEGELDEY